jgi:CRP-like cAMP-binding protein
MNRPMHASDVDQHSRVALPLLARRIHELTFDSALRAKRRAALIGRATALERISTFLLEMVDGHPGEACGVVLLPSRHDIADYLSLAIKTLSRVLTCLCARRDPPRTGISHATH